jgi:hypothetical protein
MMLMELQIGSSAIMVRPTWIDASRQGGKAADPGQHQVDVPNTDPLVQRLRSGLAARTSTGVTAIQHDPQRNNTAVCCI